MTARSHAAGSTTGIVHDMLPCCQGLHRAGCCTGPRARKAAVRSVYLVHFEHVLRLGPVSCASLNPGLPYPSAHFTKCQTWIVLLYLHQY